MDIFSKVWFYYKDWTFLFKNETKHIPNDCHGWHQPNFSVNFRLFGQNFNKVNKQNCRIWGSESHNEWLFDVDFGTVASLGHFSSKMSSQWLALPCHAQRIFVSKNWREWHGHLVLTWRGHLPHSQRNNPSFAHRFWKSNNQPKFWCQLTALELWFQPVGLLLFDYCRLLLLGQCRRLHRSSAGPTSATFVSLNLPTFSRNVAQYRPYNKPIVIFTMAFRKFRK